MSVRIDPPPSHRAGRFLVALVLIAVLVATVVTSVLAGAETWLVDNGRVLLEEVRGWWTS